jgi:glycosyltransferase involved in cell wall biosynthesis
MSGTVNGRLAAGQPAMLTVATVPGTITGFLLPYMDRLRDRGWRVDAAAADGREVPELTDHVDHLWRVPWSRRSIDPRNITTALAATRRLLRHGRYDVVHAHTPVAALVTRLAVAMLPARDRPAVAYTAHGFHFDGSGRDGPIEWLFARLERIAGRWTDRLIVINEVDREMAERLQLVPTDRILHLPGIGVDLDWYRPTPGVRAGAAALRSALGLSDADTLFAMVAYFDPRKNHRLVLQALHQLGRRDLHVAFAGEGSLQAVYAAEAEQLGIADRVHFLGAIDDVRPLIAASVATLLPSFREGLSRAVLESLAMGVPVLGSRVRGVAELVEPGGGTLIDPTDAGALAAAMAQLATDPAGCFDRAAVDERLQPCRIDHLLAAHDEMYDELLAQRRSERTLDR